ncbi:MAG TPA: type VI secretion IcmF C-terminal domain-containing protein [Myxococcaceae bacterium]
MEARQNIWTAVQPHLGWILAVLGVLLVVALAVGVWWWLRKKRGPEVPGAQRPLDSGRLVGIRKRFLNGLPWRYRAAVMDFPTLVVLGPAGSGKTKLIDLDVDWRRQANQFMPSYTDDPLMQIYFGPDVVVQELSAPLLEDGSAQARTALRKLWRATFGKLGRGVVVVVLDVRWLVETPPDDVRRVTQLLRGKINLIAEVRKEPIETRLCLTHMDTLPGYADFAQLLRKNGVPLDLEVPQRGEEERLATALQSMEKYLALGLTSLPVDAFERLEAFYSRGGESFKALSRFIAALWEGGTLAFPPRLTRVYLSSPTPEARASGTLAVAPEKKTQFLQKNYRWVHLRRCAIALAVCAVPVLAAYGNFYLKLQEAQRRMVAFNDTVSHLKKQHQRVEGAVIEGQADKVMEAMDGLLNSEGYWPLLRRSFKDERAKLSANLAEIIREAYLRPMLQSCQTQCVECGSSIPGCLAVGAGAQGQAAQADSCGYEKAWCRPELMLHVQALLYASNQDELGKFVLRSLHSEQKGTWRASMAKALGAGAPTRERNWIDALELHEPMIFDYILASARPWRSGSPDEFDTDEGSEGKRSREEDLDWARWPFQGLTTQGQIAHWRTHFTRLQAWIDSDELDMEQWRSLQKERHELKRILADQLLLQASARKIIDLLNASQAEVNKDTFVGIDSTLEALDWTAKHRAEIEGVLQLEAATDEALEAAEKMSPAQLLTQAEGLFEAGTDAFAIEFAVPKREFRFVPAEVSRQLLRKYLQRLDRTDRLAFDAARQAPGTAVAGMSVAGMTVLAKATEEGFEDAGGEAVPSGQVVSRVVFDAEVKPLVDEFTELIAKSKLTQEEAAKREAYVLGKVTDFAERYRRGIFATYRDYRLTADKSNLSNQLSTLVQPSSPLVEMLREVTHRASVGPLDGRLYAPLRDGVAPFKPIVQLMTPDKDGNYPALGQYITLVAQLQGEITGIKPAGTKAPAKGAEAKAGKEEAEGEPPGTQLAELLSPLARASLSMLLEEEGSYLNRVDAWLDQQGILGEFRKPFRQPFLLARNIGREELEQVLKEEWTAEYKRVLEPLLKRYPFNPDAQQEIDPAELAVLRRKDGEFWQFINRVMSPIIVERGSDWTVRTPLRSRVLVPQRMVSTLNQVSRLSRILWDDEGKPMPISLQVRPLPLPRAPTPGDFVTMSYFKCGAASSFGFNQSPTWQEFPVSWWDQRTASLGVELRSPVRDGKRYRTVEMANSSWSCFRLLDLGSFTDEQNMVWALPGPDGDVSAQELEVSFGLRGEPWAAFRRNAK